MEEYYKLKYATTTMSLIEPYLSSTSEVESSIGGNVLYEEIYEFIGFYRF